MSEKEKKPRGTRAQIAAKHVAAMSLDELRAFTQELERLDPVNMALLHDGEVRLTLWEKPS